MEPKIPTEIAELLAREWSASTSADDQAELANWRRLHPESEATVEALELAYSSSQRSFPVSSPERLRSFVARLRQSIDSDLGHATEARPAATPAIPVPGQMWYRSAVAWMSLVAAVVVIGILTQTSFSDRRHNTLVTVQEMATTRGQRTTITLTDGTTIRLAPSTRLRTSATFGQSDREVTLDGEAYFEVAPDPARPFIVKTTRAQTTVLGTAFNVKQYASDNATEVSVVDGRVSVGAAVLSAGDVAIAHGDDDVSVSKRPIETMIGWTQNRLYFDRVPMSEVIPVLERWYDIRITLTDPKIGKRQLIATVERDSVEDIIQLIAASLNLTYHIRGRSVELGTAAYER